VTLVSAQAPRVTEIGVTFSWRDEKRVLAGVRLVQELRRPRHGPDFRWDADKRAWELFFERAPVDRMEYLLELIRADGSVELVRDPANPLSAPGPFGSKSVVEFPGYRTPGWVRSARSGGDVVSAKVASRTLKTTIPVHLWSSTGSSPTDELPLLVVHDGPDYAAYAGLLMLLSTLTEQARLPPMRAALVGAVDRDQTYSASAAYARALAHEVLPVLGRLAPVPHGRTMRVGMGASLGALAMLHTHRAHPASFGALFLQSGSYFQPRFDAHESGFVRFGRITRNVSRVLAADGWAHPVPVAMTCGAAEENLANNRATRRALVSQGYEVSFLENRDAHNWVGWRDCFEPALVELLTALWGT
jgi:enterochelin esterase-like enzyme